MDTLQDLFSRQIEDLPNRIGLQVVGEKLRQLGVYTEARAASLLAHIRAGDDRVEWDIEGVDDDLTIDFGDADIARIDELLKNFADGVPEMLKDLVDEIARDIAKAYRREWKAYRPYEKSEFELFRMRLEDRWGKGFDALRMLLSVCRDFGATAADQFRKSRATKGRIRRQALFGLHMRGCQITAEIICLMENGYADGAMARWRTLHELTIVAFLLEGGDDALARRYLDHQVVDRYKTMKSRLEAGPLRGEKTLTSRDVAEARSAYDAVLAVHGPEFRHDYGWAATVVPGNANPNFVHLEKAAGKAAMRSYYKFASQNVHAGSGGLAIRLGARHGAHNLIAGASNTGFWEPGQNAAFSIVQLTSTLGGPPYTLDQLTLMRALVEMRDAVPPPLAAADRKIGREERANAKAAALRRTG